jgi:hypothetical protein
MKASAPREGKKISRPVAQKGGAKLSNHRRLCGRRYCPTPWEPHTKVTGWCKACASTAAQVWIGSDLDGEELGPADEGETAGVGHTELRIEEKRGL